MSHTQLFAQIDMQKLSWIGYACGYSMEPTESVQKVENLLYKKEYDNLAKLFENGNPAEKYLAAVSLEYLQKNSIRKVKIEEQLQIEKTKASVEFISFCSGCTESYYRVTFELFEGDQFNEAIKWLDNQFKKD